MPVMAIDEKMGEKEIVKEIIDIEELKKEIDSIEINQSYAGWFKDAKDRKNKIENLEKLLIFLTETEKFFKEKGATNYFTNTKSLYYKIALILDKIKKGKEINPGIIDEIYHEKYILSGILHTFLSNETELVGKGMEVSVKSFSAHFLANKVVKKIFVTKDPSFVMSYINWMKLYQERFNQVYPKFRLMPAEIKVHPMRPDKIKSLVKGQKYTVFFVQNRIDQKFLVGNILKDANPQDSLKILKDLIWLTIMIIRYNLNNEIMVSGDITMKNFMYYQGSYYFLDYQIPLIKKANHNMNDILKFWKACQTNGFLKATAFTQKLVYFKWNFDPPHRVARVLLDFYYKSAYRTEKFKQLCLNLTKEIVTSSRLPPGIIKSIIKNLKITPLKFMQYIGKFPEKESP